MAMYCAKGPVILDWPPIVEWPPPPPDDDYLYM